MACGMYGFSRDAQLQTTVQDVVEITNGQPWQNSSQKCVLEKSPMPLPGS
jgi:hypothetical protein